MNGNKTGKESVSLTRALMAISTAKTYLEDMKVDFPGLSRRVDSWINKLSFISTDAFSSMTPNGREVYRRLIQKEDPLQFEHLFLTLCEMSPEQRNLLEKAAEALLKGELEIVE